MTKINDTLTNTLIKLEKNDKLAHFYLMSPSSATGDNQAWKWACNMLKELSSAQDIFSHQDILVFRDGNEQKQYKSEILDEVFSFLKYEAHELKRKYLLINELHKLTEGQLNKLLKTLEEPPIQLTVFIINNNKAKVLKTIESRAINLRIPTKKESNQLTELSSYITDQSAGIQELIDLAQNNSLSVNNLAEAVLHLASQFDLNEELFTQIQTSLKELEEDITFNNSQNSKIHKIFHCISSLRQTL